MPCLPMSTKKYTSRPGPPYPAQECKGKYKIGNDNYSYRSEPNVNGVYRWVKSRFLTSKPKPKAKPKRKSASKAKPKPKPKRKSASKAKPKAKPKRKSTSNAKVGKRTKLKQYATGGLSKPKEGVEPKYITNISIRRNGQWGTLYGSVRYHY